MRNAVLALVVLLSATTAAPTQSESWAQKMFSDAKTTHDFGTVARGAKLSHRFPIRNIYAVPLQITNTRASCGCITITPSVNTIPSKETAHIDVTVDTRRYTGPKTFDVFITFGPQYVSTATLQVSANSRPDVVFNPGEANFGNVPRGQAPTQVIDVEYAGNLDWRVSEVVKTGAPLDVTLKEWYRRRGEVGYKVHVTLRADAPVGNLKQELYLRTNDPASPMVPLLVEANVQAPLSVIPDKVTLRNARVGETVTTSVLVRGGKPFQILGIDGLGDGLEADFPTSTGPLQKVTFKYRPSQPAELRRQVQIRTRAEEKDTTVLVTVEATAVP